MSCRSPDPLLKIDALSFFYLRYALCIVLVIEFFLQESMDPSIASLGQKQRYLANVWLVVLHGSYYHQAV